VNLGKLKWQEGYFSRAAAMWDEAWQLTKDSTERGGRDLADIAVSEWLTGAMTFGQVDKLQRRLDEIGRRSIGGPAGNKVTEAREGLWQLTNHHEMAVYSGPEALKALMSVTGKSTPRAFKQIDTYQPPHMGTSIVALRDLAKEAGVDLEMRFVEDATEIPVPSIVHLKSEHYSAVIATRDNVFVLRDRALGGEMMMSRNALRDESSGYVLVPASSGGMLGRSVASDEAVRVVGRCHPGIPVEAPCNCLGEKAGMATYTLHPSMAAVVVTDTPLTYSPPRGPAILWTLRYNHRSTRLGAVPTSSNVGPLWSFDWLSYVQDNNTMIVAPFTWKDVILRGESIEKYTTFGGSTHWRSRATIAQVANDPPRYERQLPDGTIEVFTFPDRAASLPNRKIFLTELIDPEGNTVTFSYDSSIRLVAVMDAVGQVTTVSYENPTDPLLVTSITDPFGRTAHLSYDGEGRLASITDAVGMTSSFAYDETDFMTSMTTPYGTTTFRRGPDSLAAGQFRRVEATDPEGGTERLEYHLGTTAGLPEQVAAAEVPAGFEAWNQEMDQYNSLYWSKHAMTVAPGALSSAVITKWLLYPEMAYQLGHAWDIPHSIKRPLETRVWYRYPNQSPTGSGLAGTGHSPTMIARVLAGGATQLTQMTYNAQGMVTSKIDPLGRQTTYSYASNGIDLLEERQITSTGSELLSTYASYNAQHLPGTVTDAAGQTTTMTYNASGKPLTVTNSKNETTSYTYDSGPTGYLVSITDPIQGSITTFTYDAPGRIRTATDPDGYTVTIDYDGLNRVTKRTYPDGTFEQLTYQRLDLVEERDRKGRVTRYYYDGIGRRTATRDPLGRVTGEEWCACGALKAIIDPRGQRTTWEFDVQGRVFKEVRADGVTDSVFTYDVAGRLATSTDPKNQVTHYLYFADDSLNSTTYTNAVVATPGVSYAYDAFYPRLATMTDGIGVTAYAYKAPGQLGAGQIATIDGPLADDIIGYGYDEVGRVTTRTINGSANSVTFVLDALGRMTSAVNALGTFTYAYSGVTSRLATVSYPNGQTTTYSYQPTAQDRRLATIQHRYPGGALLSQSDYSYDVIGNISTRQSQIDGSPTALWTYGYDSADQLTHAIEHSTVSPPTTLRRYAYGYDSAGNRAFEQSDDHVRAATYDPLNRLVTYAPGGPLSFRGVLNEPATVTVDGTPAIVDSTNVFRGARTLPSGTSVVSVTAADPSGNQTIKQYQVTVGGGATNFTYDADGNLTSDGVRTYQWDAKNRLVSVMDGATTIATFAYDGNGRRIQKVVAGVTHSYVYDDMHIAEERLSGTSSGIVRYFHGPGTDDWQGRQNADGSSTYFTTDHIGSVLTETNSAGTVTLTRQYDAWGNLDSTSAAVGGPAFSGREWDAETGLYYYRARYYDPKTGRFISEDPIGLDGDDVNFYTYVWNRPTNFVDPGGLAGKRGGPWHPPDGVGTRCYPSDDCPTLRGKMFVLLRMIRSHTGWDRSMPRPRGGNKHAIEIAELWQAFARCQAYYIEKCTEKPKCDDECKKNARRAAKTGAAAVGAYAAYRCIRMIPSLFPPLWPTIPLNAAAP
jgi:RHS repeat-associated protein